MISHKGWFSAATRRLVGIFCLLGIGLLTASRVLADSPHEREQLHLLLGQLEQVSALARRAQASLPAEPKARYRFDYAALQQDIEQLRTAVSDYLSPERAQPRLPLELPAFSPSYRLDSRAAASGRPHE